MKQDLNDELVSEMTNLQISGKPIELNENQYVSQEGALPHESTTNNNNKTMMKDSLNSDRSPTNFIKPPVPLVDQSKVAPDMKHVQSLYETYVRKSYMSGYLFKKQDENWSRCYAELCGPTLALWETSYQQNKALPVFSINIAHAKVQLSDKNNVFTLYTHEDIYLFDAPDYANWVYGIRLSSFEYSKIHELFTHSFVSRYTDILAKPSKKMEGYVQACFEGSADWKKYWAVVSDVKQEKKKRLFVGKKSVKAEGRILFYETKKSKSPVFTMEQVTRSYIIYPELPDAIDAVSTLRVEAKVVNENNNITSALIMAPSTKDLVKWAVGTFDAFKLYGRPEAFHNNDSQLLYFTNTPHLFLELTDVDNNLDIQLERVAFVHSQMAKILQNKLQRPSNKIIQHSRNQQHRTSVNSSKTTNKYSPSVHQVYDSDEDSGEETGDEEEEESDDGDFILSSLRPQRSSSSSVNKRNSDSDKKSTSTKDSTFSSSLQRTAASSNSSLSLHSQTGIYKPGSIKRSGETNSFMGNKSRSKISPTQASISSSSHQIEEDYFPEDAYSFINPQQNQWPHSTTMMEYQSGDDEDDEEYVGPTIPSLGEHFVTQNSLLDTYRPPGPSAHDQEDYARATGQPLIQVAQKPGAPRAGLVGMISQIEQDRKREANKRNRYTVDPRTQMMQQVNS